MTIAAFEFLPMDDIYRVLFNIEGQSFSSKFEELGMDHHLTMNNLGTLGFIMAMLIPLCFIHKIISYCQVIRCCRRVARRLGNILYFGLFLRLIMESFVIGFLATLINLRSIDFSNEDSWTFANAIITCILLPIFILFPVFATLLMLGNWNMLHTKHLKPSFGEIYDGFSLQSRSMTIYWGLDYLRKILLCLVVIVAPKLFFVQMGTLYLTSTALTIAACHTNARIRAFDTFMDVFNEAKLIVIMYHLMHFTMYCPPDSELRKDIGYSCFVILVLGILTNMMMMIIAPIVAFRKKCYICCAKRRFKIRLEERDERRVYKVSALGFGERRNCKQDDLVSAHIAMLYQIHEARREERLVLARKEAHRLWTVSVSMPVKKRERRERERREKEEADKNRARTE